MARIVIKDLADSLEMDRAAMASVYGGARNSRQAAGLQLQTQQSAKLSILDLARGKQLGKK